MEATTSGDATHEGSEPARERDPEKGREAIHNGYPLTRAARAAARHGTKVAVYGRW